jgi:predicted Zn-dependent peptidase
MSRVRSVALGIWVRSGSREDPPGRGGLAHLVEHMSFKGTARRSALEIAQAIDSLGGNLNGATAKESTFFHTNVLAEGLPVALDVLGEMLTQPLFSPDDLRREQAVVLEEIRGSDDDPQDLVLRLLFSRLWTAEHPLGRPILGTQEEVAALTADDLWEFFRAHYRPANMVLAAAGRVEPEELLARALEIWPAERDGRARKRIAPTPSSGVVTASRDIQQVHLALGFPTVRADSPERYGLEVLSGLLGGGFSSRLFQRVREERGLAYTILSSTAYYTDAGALLIYAATEEKRLPETLGLIWDEIERVTSSTPSPEEVKRAIDRLRGGMLLGLEDPAGRMFRLGTNAAVGREILPVREVERLISQVTPEQVRELAERFLRPERAALALVGAAEERLRRAASAHLEVVE